VIRAISVPDSRRWSPDREQAEKHAARVFGTDLTENPPEKQRAADPKNSKGAECPKMRPRQLRSVPPASGGGSARPRDQVIDPTDRILKRLICTTHARFKRAGQAGYGPTPKGQLKEQLTNFHAVASGQLQRPTVERTKDGVRQYRRRSRATDLEGVLRAGQPSTAENSPGRGFRVWTAQANCAGLRAMRPGTRP
jgi:hypothetical protein